MRSQALSKGRPHFSRDLKLECEEKQTSTKLEEVDMMAVLNVESHLSPACAILALRQLEAPSSTPKTFSECPPNSQCHLHGYYLCILTPNVASIKRRAQSLTHDMSLTTFCNICYSHFGQNSQLPNCFILHSYCCMNTLAQKQAGTSGLFHPYMKCMLNMHQNMPPFILFVKDFI